MNIGSFDTNLCVSCRGVKSLSSFIEVVTPKASEDHIACCGPTTWEETSCD